MKPKIKIITMNKKTQKKTIKTTINKNLKKNNNPIITNKPPRMQQRRVWVGRVGLPHSISHHPPQNGGWSANGGGASFSPRIQAKGPCFS